MDAEGGGGLFAVAVVGMKGFEEGCGLGVAEGVELAGFGLRGGGVGRAVDLGEDFAGQVPGEDEGLSAEDECVFDDVLEFADVSGELVVHEDFEGFVGEAPDGFAALGGKALDEMAGEQWNVFAAFAQGWKVQPDDVEAVVEVIAEGFLGDEDLEGPVRGGDDADVGLDRFGGAEGLVFAFLEDAEQLNLEGVGHVADFVEKEGAAFGDGESAGFIGMGVGEGAFFVAEQLGFEKGFGQGAAVDGDETVVFAGAEFVEGPRDEFFAGAAGALDEDGAAALGDVGEDVEDAVHYVVFADDALEGVAVAELLAQGFDSSEIAEGFDAAGQVAVGIPQDGRADADRYFFAAAVEDGDALADNLLSGFDGAAQGAHGLADIRAENVEALLADGLIAGHAGDFLGGAVEGRDVPVGIDAEHAVGDGIENDALGIGRFHGGIIGGEGCRIAMEGGYGWREDGGTGWTHTD